MRAVLLVALAACNPYDGDLGPAPFLCGAAEPRCPSGYSCLEDNGREVCFEDGSSSGDDNCADDGALEPNNVLEMASPAPLDGTRTFALENLTICPGVDKDYYAVTLATTNEGIDVTVDTSATLRVAIVNQSGIPINASSSTPITARALNLPAGQYYVQVAGSGGALPEHSYKVTIAVSGP